MCGKVNQFHAVVSPGMTLTVKYEDGTYRQHTWGLPVKGHLVYNAREEELDLTWGKRPPRVEIPLEGFYERDVNKEWVYFKGPYTAKGIVVGDKVLIVTTKAQGIVRKIHSRQPLQVV